MSGLTVASTRRNGLPSSCEPCRKSKLKCDHSTPICDRCKRRGKAESCVYHPAPLTQRRSSGGTTSLATPRKRKHEEGRKSADAEKNGVSTAKDPLETTSTHSPGSEGIVAKLGHWGKTRASVSTPGFLGLTSYSAVFSENEGNLGVATQNAIEQEAKDLAGAAVEPETIDPRHIQLGAQLLLLLDDLIQYETLAERWYELSGGFVIGEPMIRMALKSTKEEFDFLLMDSVDKKLTMLAFSKKIFDNSLKPIGTTSSMISGEYISLVAGPNARWEMVGLVFSILGLGAVLAPPWHPIFNRERDGKPIIEKKDFGIQATEAADICLQFCDNAGTVNDPLSWLLFQHTHLLTLVYGDNDYRPWRRLGDLSTTIFALGLHQTAKSDDDTPFFLAELRKRVMGGAYSMDKQLATFLGRPPRITWRYCNVELPLDLSYDELVAEPAAREAAISKLDANGWNTEGNTCKASWTRIALLMGYIREDILEMSLSPRIENFPQRIEEISRRSNETFASLPAFLRYKLEMEDSLEADQSTSLLLSIHLDFLYNDFLLQRILVKRMETRSEALIAISREILHIVLLFVSKSNRSLRANCDLGWNVSYYGLPTAGVLAIELLRQSQQPQGVPSSSTLPRSEAIQNLSVFAACLQTAIQPGEGNYDICQQARKAIKHILDRVLSFERGPSLPSAQEASATDWLGGNPGLGMVPDDGTDFMKWLDNLDWGQEPWTTFN